MRVPVGKALRVGPGDEVVVQARLPMSSKLGRLFVFASDGGEYSPYTDDVDVVSDKPRMVTPMSLRLTPQNPLRELKFVSCVDGCIRIMQEIDTANEQRAKIRIHRKVCPSLGWREWVTRKFIRILPW